MSKQTPVALEFEGEALEGVFVGRRDGQARPTVMLIPTVMGVSDLEIGFAKQLVELGYNGFVADIFGKKFRGSPRDVMFGEMNRLGNDRVALRRRLLAIVEQVRGLKEVEGGKLVVAGYCFGGKCALDVARTGVDIAAAVAFHGLLDPPNWPTEKTSTKILAFHAWDEPAERVVTAAVAKDARIVMPRPGESIEPASAPAVRGSNETCTMPLRSRRSTKTRPPRFRLR